MSSEGEIKFVATAPNSESSTMRGYVDCPNVVLHCETCLYYDSDISNMRDQYGPSETLEESGAADPSPRQRVGNLVAALGQFASA